MPVQTTYPGVYVIEEPSGVRTIAGVSTSIATFIGRTKKGPLEKPILCLNYTDFERVFSSEYAESDMVRSVRLFFLNGGNQCYIMRIADGAQTASITLKNEKKADVLKIIAKSAGEVGNTIRLSVSYNTQQPESTFNIEVFRWAADKNGQLLKVDTENWQALSMNPNSGRYAPSYVSQNSNLIDVEDKFTLPAPAAPPTLSDAYSQSGRPLPNATFKAALDAILLEGTQFRMNVNGNPVNIDINGLDTAIANVEASLISLINGFLPASTPIKAILETGPNSTKLIKLSCKKGDIRIDPAASNDVAQRLMLGTAQGGIEASLYSDARPAPTGMVFKLPDLASFAALNQTTFNNILINTTNIALTPPLPTVAGGASLMYNDNFTPAPTINGNNDGVREKWSIIANKVNEKRINDSTFRWSAQVWGSRLALIGGEGGDNSKGTIVTGVAALENIGGNFTSNVRFYSLGATGVAIGEFQGSSEQGLDGNAPTLDNYAKAFTIIDKEVDLFNLMVLPKDFKHTEDTIISLWGPTSVFCLKRRAFLLMDSLDSWKKAQQAVDPSNGVAKLRNGLVKDHSAVFYPRVTIRENGLNVQTGPCGAIAGLMARTDANRGVWKAPAGTEADIRGISGLDIRFSDDENGVLNPHAVNTLRIFPNGIVNWGARTMDGDDDFGSEYKYIPVRRTALFIEESLYRGLKWVVFEPNDEPLWAQIRLNVGAFMHNLFRQGAFQGQQKKDAYFVKCDGETTTQNDINLGIVNVWVGFAPLKPAEFVILHLQQMTGQIQV